MDSDQTRKVEAPLKKTRTVRYRKPPQAPRRFKSSYMFFSTEKHKEIRDRLKNLGKEVKTTNIAKMVSLEWKALSAEERKPWDELARKDKVRYEVEKSMYTGPWRVPSAKRAPKNPNAPKRPMSAFLSFAQTERPKVRNEHPNMTNTEVSRILSQRWKNAPEDIRSQHIETERHLRGDYKLRMAEWKEEYEKELSEHRLQREEEVMAAIRAGVRPSDQEGRMQVGHASLSTMGGAPATFTNQYQGMAYAGNAQSYYETESMGAYPQSAYAGYAGTFSNRTYAEQEQPSVQRQQFPLDASHLGDPYGPSVSRAMYQEGADAMYAYYPPNMYGATPQQDTAGAAYDVYYGSTAGTTYGGSYPPYSSGGPPEGYSYRLSQSQQQQEPGDYLLPPQYRQY